MQTENPFLNQFAKAMSEAAGAADGVRREAETVMRGQLQKLIADLEIVTREEFEAVKEMASKARAENEALQMRITELESALASRKAD
jgi:BMFP domain-containing protein YqiC